MWQGSKDKMFGKHRFVAIPQTHRCLLKSHRACSAACLAAGILDALMAKGPRLALNNKTPLTAPLRQMENMFVFPSASHSQDMP